MVLCIMGTFQWGGQIKYATKNCGMGAAKAKEDGLKVEVNWQDGDSSSAKELRYSFDYKLESKIMLCGGHIGRAHSK